jgi:putative membrane protein
MDFPDTYANRCSRPLSGQDIDAAIGSGAWARTPAFPAVGIVRLLILGLITYFTVRPARNPATHSGPGTPVDVLERRDAAVQSAGQRPAL